MDSQVIVGFCAGQNLSVPTIGVVRPPDSKPPITINTRSAWAGKYKGILRTAVMSGMFYIYDVVRRVCIY